MAERSAWLVDHVIPQRFGSALNLNVHFQVIALDGVYVRGPDGELHFRHVVPHTEDVERMVVEIAVPGPGARHAHGGGGAPQGDRTAVTGTAPRA